MVELFLGYKFKLPDTMVFAAHAGFRTPEGQIDRKKIFWEEQERRGLKTRVGG
jgi:hypothetical protein